MQTPATTMPPPGLWHYATVPGHYDELTANGTPRPAWRKLVTALEAMGPAELQRRWEQGRRLIHENGVTYNVYGDPRGLDRPWQLDAVPLVIGTDDWRQIEQAVIQRATLLNMVLNDLYGPQRLLREGLLPAGLVYANRGYLRPLQGVTVPHDVHLHTYAADLGRSPTGQWWVIADRTQAPSGAGYALENRMVSNRSLADVFRDCQVMRLAEFFARSREMLVKIAPANKDNPRIVLLTPGPYNETYFEHAYLARYLGLLLVEGGDLLVRDNRVYLRTLTGLLPVDVILRRQDDVFCDPLELRDDSLLGVPGLVQAVRAKTVVVANALGSGLVNTPAMIPFMPGLCKALLDEDLKMSAVTTWWCGQETALATAIDQIDQLVIKPAFTFASNQVIFGDTLSAQGRSDLLEKLRRRPHQFVAQERVALSTAPTWNDATLEPRHIVIRVFATATADGKYVVMPGGLTRVSGSRDSINVSTQAGGGSKDTWIISDKPVTTMSMWQSSSSHQVLSRASFYLSSRVADNLFWLGRYVERVDDGVQVIRNMLRHMTDETELADAEVIAGLGEVLAAQGRTLGAFTGAEGGFDRSVVEPQLMSVLFDEDRPFSLRGDIIKVHRIASRVRDRISLDSWRIMNRLYDEFVMPDVVPAMLQHSALELLDNAVLTLAAFSGQTMEGMTREKGWRFLDLGRRIERSLALITLLRFGLWRHDAVESQRLEAVLEIANSVMTYRSRYMSAIEAATVLDLLLIDESNPRSLAFQLVELAAHVDSLAADAHAVSRTSAQRVVMSMQSAARLAEVDELARVSEQNMRPALIELFDRLKNQMDELGAILLRTYLSHARKPQSLTDFSFIER